MKAKIQLETKLIPALKKYSAILGVTIKDGVVIADKAYIDISFKDPATLIMLGYMMKEAPVLGQDNKTVKAGDGKQSAK